MRPSLLRAGRTCSSISSCRLGGGNASQNGEVAGWCTASARGRARRGSGLSQAVCRSLGFLSSERLEDEKQVLEAETARRAYDLSASLLNWRYGAAGYGLTGMRETWDLERDRESTRRLLPLSALQGNAVLWFSGPPPAGLRLHLPDGVKQPLPRLIPVREEPPVGTWTTPAGEWRSGSTGPRSSSATIFCTLAGKMLRDRLRAKQAVSYAPQVFYEPLDADTAHVVLYADSEPERRAELTREFVDEFEGLGRVSNAPSSRRPAKRFSTY